MVTEHRVTLKKDDIEITHEPATVRKTAINVELLYEKFSIKVHTEQAAVSVKFNLTKRHSHTKLY